MRLRYPRLSAQLASFPIILVDNPGWAGLAGNMGSSAESADRVPMAPHAADRGGATACAPRSRPDPRPGMGPALATIGRNGTARTGRTDTPGSAASLFDSQGALLGVIPLGAGSRLAVVGYLLPPARRDDPVRLDGRPSDGLVVDAAQHRALVNGHDIGLVYREFELLAFLTARPCRAFTRAHLLASVWGAAYQGSSRTVDVHIHRLRRKLGPEYGQRLVTMRHLGYVYQPPRGS